MQRPARRRHFSLTAVLAVLLIVAAACGGGRDEGTTATTGAPGTTAGGGDGGSTTTTAPSSEALIDPSRCQDTTTGVTDTEIKIGTSHPESGIAAAFGKIAEGIKAYFGYINAEESGVQGHQLTWIGKDDGYEAGRTVTNVNELVQSDQVFALFNNVGTANNLAVWDQLDQQCIPNLLAATGDQGLNDPEGHPFTLIGNPAYATESAVFAQYLKDNNPEAKVAILYQNDDYGKAYLDPLQKAIEGTGITVVAQESYEPTDANVDSQITTLAASGADTLFIGATGLKCPQAMDAAAGKGFTTEYLSGTCTAAILMGLAQPASTNGVISTVYIKDPTDPQWADDEQMKLFKEKAPQYNSAADVNDGLQAYGWSQAAVLVEILKQSPSLDRVDVMNTARALDLPTPPGLFLPDVPWKTDGTADGFPIETFYLGKYNSTSKLFELQGDPIDFEGKTGDVIG